jgi:hypothetical protein
MGSKRRFRRGRYQSLEMGEIRSETFKFGRKNRPELGDGLKPSKEGIHGESHTFRR